MFDIGLWELLLVAVVALIVVGPERFPALVHASGLWLGRVQAALQTIKNDFSKELRAEELKRSLTNEDPLDLKQTIHDDENNPLLQDDRQNGNNDQQSLIAHLAELRNRLLRGILAVLLFTLCLFPFANDLYSFVAKPLFHHLPESSSMIATQVASPFLAPFNLSLITAILFSVPVLLYQLWAFIAPGLYQHERKLVFPLLFSSSLLFFVGIVFAYFVVFPLIFGFFIHSAPQGTIVMTDISNYLDFVLTMFFAFGFAFEVPVATVLLVWTGVTNVKSLTAKRPYIIVAAFMLGMLLTPPDIFSQSLLAIPIWLLFEGGLLACRFLL